MTIICRKRKTSDEIAAEKRIQRGPGISVKRIADKKLRGQLKHTETVFRQSQAKAIKVNEWLLPSDSGFLEAEGACLSVAWAPMFGT